MLNWHMLEQLQQARAQDLACEMERQRRIHLALASRPPRARRGPQRFGRVLIWLGGRLMTWGSRLQAQGAASVPSVPRKMAAPSPITAPWPNGSLFNGTSQDGRRAHRNRADDPEQT